MHPLVLGRGETEFAGGPERPLTWLESEVWNLTGEDCFKAAEAPDDWSDLAHERAAYEQALHLRGIRTET